jgi:hypothetical protein
LRALPLQRLSIALAITIATLWLGISAALAQTFHDYPCTVDCSGHEAGYEWADKKGIEDPDDCGGNSNSFIEGCRAWAEEQEEEQDGELNADEDSDD